MKKEEIRMLLEDDVTCEGQNVMEVLVPVVVATIATHAMGCGSAC